MGVGDTLISTTAVREEINEPEDSVKNVSLPLYHLQ